LQEIDGVVEQDGHDVRAAKPELPERPRTALDATLKLLVGELLIVSRHSDPLRETVGVMGDDLAEVHGVTLPARERPRPSPLCYWRRRGPEHSCIAQLPSDRPPRIVTLDE